MTRHQYVGAIDQGTSSTRFMLFDRKGQVVGKAQKEHRQIYPQAGWVEHDPEEIWDATVAVVREVMDGVEAGAVASIGITNQRETTVVWDKRSGKPLYNAIVWNDTRTDEVAKRFAAKGRGGKDRLRHLTGLPIVSYFSATKLRWLMDNVPKVRAAVEDGHALFGTIDTWLVWKLTEGHSHVTDVSNGCRTLLMNIHTLQWDDELLRAFGVPRAVLPDIVPSSAVVGRVREGACPALADVPIAGILGDQQAATFGQVCFKEGMAKSTYGTGAFIMMNTGNAAVPSTRGLLTTVGWQLGPDEKPVYCLEGGVAYAGSLIQWLRDNLEMVKSAADSEPLAVSAGDNGGVYFVPAFAGLFAPHWRPDARGVICGLTSFNTRAHVVRAALEASAFQVREVLDAMAQDSGSRLGTVRADGGMTANATLMQFQADILDAKVTVPRISETTAVGAAYAAGLAVHFFASTDALATMWAEDRSWLPAMDEGRRQRLYAGWQKAVRRTLNWAGPEEEESTRMGPAALVAVAAAALCAGITIGRLAGGRGGAL